MAARTCVFVNGPAHGQTVVVRDPFDTLPADEGHVYRRRYVKGQPSSLFYYGPEVIAHSWTKVRRSVDFGLTTRV